MRKGKGIHLLPCVRCEFGTKGNSSITEGTGIPYSCSRGTTKEEWNGKGMCLYFKKKFNF